jgi:tRNA(fMet)-specific endonuclease VapC
MSQIVVDTDVASYIFNWHSSAQRYIDALRASELILSFMSIAEMRMGAVAAGWGVRRRTLLEQFIRGFGVVYADDAMCSSWATLRAGARAAGRALSPQDAWIAATALELGSPLATNNRSDFERIPRLRLLSQLATTVCRRFSGRIGCS